MTAPSRRGCRSHNSAPGQYDRSGGFRCRLPAPPPAVRGRSDAVRDCERLGAAFRSLIDCHDAAARELGGGAPSPSGMYDAFDEAIAAANAVSDTLCEWRAALAAAAAAASASSQAP